MRKILGVLLAAALPLAASASDHSPDLRTTIPELLAKDRNWGASLGLGLTSNSGNDEQLIVKTELSLFKKWDDFVAYISGRYLYLGTGDPLVRAQNLGAATFRIDRFFSDEWRLFVFTTHAYNEFQGVSYRSSYGGGPWYQTNLGAFTNGASLAAVFEAENYYAGSGKDIGRLSFRDVMSYAISPNARLNLDFFVIPAFKDFSDFRLMLNPSLEAGIIGDTLSVKVYSLLERYSQPPAGIKQNDVEFGTSVTLKFGE